MNKRGLYRLLDGCASPLLALAVAASQIQIGHHKNDVLLILAKPAAELHPNYRVPPNAEKYRSQPEAWAAPHKESTHNK